MRIEELLELEARLKQSVESDDREVFRETITRICAELRVPAEGDPAAIDRDEAARTLIEQSAKIILRATDPEPASLCAELLFCSTSPSLIFGDSGHGMTVVEYALSLSRRGTRRATLRRALNMASIDASNAGDVALALAYAFQSNDVAKELGDEKGMVSALTNALAVLVAAGDHRLAAAFGHQLIEAFDSSHNRDFLINVRMNIATSLLALRQYERSAAMAATVCEHHPSPKTRLGHWQRLSSEVVRLRCAIALNDKFAVETCMLYIIQSREKLESPRATTLREQAICLQHGFNGNYPLAIQRLNSLRKEPQTIFSLHTDTLTLLVEAHQKNGDQTGALRGLAEQMQYRSRWQTQNVSAQLARIRASHFVASPAHDDAATLIEAIQQRTSAAHHSAALPTAAMQETFERLAVAAELNEEDSGRHIYRVGRLTGLLAAEIGYDAAAADAMDRAARLHDIGKLGLPGALVARAEALSAAEHKVMREHAGTGRKILQQANDPAFDLACDIAQSHHERWDGRGYPQKLKHAAIPESARMVALTEAFDVLTHGRAYQPAVPVAAALLRLQQASGTHFEPRLVDALLKVVARLQQAHGGDDAALSDYLGDAGTASSFLQARDSMQDLVSALSPAR
jgi:putative two-component system response regulator